MATARRTCPSIANRTLLKVRPAAHNPFGYPHPGISLRISVGCTTSRFADPASVDRARCEHAQNNFRRVRDWKVHFGDVTVVGLALGLPWVIAWAQGQLVERTRIDSYSSEMRVRASPDCVPTCIRIIRALCTIS